MESLLQTIMALFAFNISHQNTAGLILCANNNTFKDSIQILHCLHHPSSSPRLLTHYCLLWCITTTSDDYASQK